MIFSLLVSNIKCAVVVRSAAKLAVARETERGLKKKKINCTDFHNL